jgi:FtsH-binding integral membrane protein
VRWTPRVNDPARPAGIGPEPNNSHRGQAMNNKELQQHILSTYNSLRLGLGVIAAATPIVIVLWGMIFGASWQDSLSAYYFAPVGDQSIYSIYPGRVLFVGILFALGSFLFLYKGFSRGEDVALNLAGAFAFGVAICPMYTQAGYIPNSTILHFTFAALLFICMAYTAIFCCNDTLQYIADPKRRARYRHTYYVIGWFMALFPLIGLVLAYFFGAVQRYLFWIEAAGIWAFAAYWFTKTIELKESEVELKAITGRLPPPQRP